MDMSKRDRVADYQLILEKAAEQLPAVTESLEHMASAEASFFFPWEYSPYRANGTTHAEPISR